MRPCSKKGAPTLLFVGANVMNRGKFTVVAVVVTRVAVDALPVSAPESVLGTRARGVMLGISVQVSPRLRAGCKPQLFLAGRGTPGQEMKSPRPGPAGAVV